MNKIIFFFSFLLISHFAIGQKEINLLGYKDSINYSEGTTKMRDTLFTEVFYQYADTSNTYIHFLDLIILNPYVAKKKKVLRLSTDTLIIQAKYRYDIFPVIQDEEIANGKVYGRIEIIEYTAKTATIKLDLYAFDSTGNEKRKFIGTRTFSKRLPKRRPK
jgi:hypothetical protein